MRVTFVQPAADGDGLAPGALDSAIGREYPLDIEGQPQVTGVITAAAVLPGGQSAELTLDIPDDSPAARALTVLGGGPGPFGIREDGTMYRPVEIRRRNPAEAAALMRQRAAAGDIPAWYAEAFIEEMTAGQRDHGPH